MNDNNDGKSRSQPASRVPLVALVVGVVGTLGVYFLVRGGGAHPPTSATATTPSASAAAPVAGGEGLGASQRVGGPEPTPGGPAAGRTGAAGVPGQSCKGLAKTCGATPEDCCASLPVQGGAFLRSYDGVTNSDKSHPATVSTFRLDKYEITVGRFRKFVKAVANGWTPLPGSGKHQHLHGGAGLNDGAEGGWDASWSGTLPGTAGEWNTKLACSAKFQTWTPGEGANETRPVNCVDWFETYAFCIWDGGFLPTEAEWNYAASGGGEQRFYPWSSPPASDAIDDTLAVFCGASCSSAQNVGAKPKGNGKWGQADLAGNLWEWTFDGYSKSYPAAACHDCAGVAETDRRVIRGGYFSASGPGLLASVRNGAVADSRGDPIGARCARAP